ncbi:hypothetical protein LJC56_04295 [Christensenellaceae bacterium OttesenSCG-928-K19]|nr:hypothetical protein [Christensenellaceae bacterium OttesenSCG-928-K19]
MKIDSYDVTTNSQRTQQSIQYSSQRFTALENNNNNAAAAQNNDDAVQLDLAGTMQQNAKNAIQQQAESLRLNNQTTPVATSPADVRIQLLESMLSALTGKRIKVTLPKFEGANSQNERIMQRMAQIAASTPQNMQLGNTNQTYSLVSEHFQHESETTTYQAQGQIKTADGQTLSVDVNLNMSRSFTSYTKTSVELKSKLVDPLVINYTGNAASLSGERFSFDLDVDGQMDQIHFAGEGSGFLALDKNNDGKINDGSELFGPSSGSGFGELRAYDKDGNGWIDENDDVFEQLVVWTKDKEGNDVMYKLKDLDIGAIYLGDTATEFSINDGDNSNKGVVRSTSFFLKENGGAGTVQHIDLSL